MSFEFQSVGSSSSDDIPPPRKPVKRPDPTNATGIRRVIHVIESDSDDDNVIVVRGCRTNVFVNEVDQACHFKSTQPAATTKKVPESHPAKDIDLAPPKFFPQAKPTSLPVPRPAVVGEDGEEDVNIEAGVSAQDEHEYSGKSGTQLEDDVKELFKGTAVNHEVEIKEGDEVVAKFTDGFRLLRHQVQARIWMKQRESEGSHGGILADDMG